MKIASIKKEDRVLTVRMNNEQLFDLGELAHSILHLISLPDWQARVAAASSATPITGDFEYLPPIAAPRKIFAIGKNYSEHAAELGSEVGDEPVVFNKLPNVLTGHESTVRLPKESEKIDFEAELVVVIGRRGKHIPREKALEHVAGYMCGNDVTARDWQVQKPGGQWLLGKSFDTFGPVGPYLVSADEIPNPQNLAIRFRLNGQVMQDSNTSNQVFPIDYLISYLSSVATLEVGDLIFTGTPSGVGVARDPRVYLKAGDEMEVEIEGLGVLRNVVGPPVA